MLPPGGAKVRNVQIPNIVALNNNSWDIFIFNINKSHKKTKKQPSIDPRTTDKAYSSVP